MLKTHRFMQLNLLALVFIIVTVVPSRSQDFSKAEALVMKSEITLKSFLADPTMDWFRKHLAGAKGVFIVPQMVRGGFIFGGSGGNGILLAQNFKTGSWSYPGFYSIGSVSFGLQIGGDVSEIILLVMTNKGLNAMLSSELKLGGDVALAAGPLGASAKAQTADILAYGRNRGAFVGITVEGAIIKPRYEMNNAFYGKDVMLTDILVNQTVSNPKAGSLRDALPERKRNSQPLGTR